MSTVAASMAGPSRSWPARTLSIQPLVLTLAAFFLPMKALAMSAGGQSVYLPYLALLPLTAVAIRPLAGIFARFFGGATLTVLGLSVFYYWQSNFDAGVFVFAAKVVVTLAMASLYIHLLRQDERAVMRYLFAGIAISIVYMVYQGISALLFGANLPLTSITALDIGRGIGQRFGFVRVTGFTEEPSYIAVILVGSALMLYTYAKRSGESQRWRIAVIVAGLLLCTSNNLFATLPLLAVFSLFFYLRVPFLFFVVFYLGNLFVAPRLLNLDESFFARFSSYSQFMALPQSRWWFGIGFNRYATLETAQYISPEGLPGLVVSSIASLWGGILLEGGIVFTTLFCTYISRVCTQARSAAGYSLVAILIMLANYYSPWWPIVSLAIAYAIVSREPFRIRESNMEAQAT